LYLHNNQLTGSIPSEIGNLTNLTYLWLSNNQLTDSIPPEIGSLVNLTWLYLSTNQLTGSIPPEIGNLTNLTSLRLNDNQLTGEIPESICDLNLNWSNGGRFNITNNQLCPPYPSCIEDYVGGQDTTNCEQVSIIDETLPIAYNLYNAYPNPFNPVTTLRYDLPEDELVNITIYDMMGRQVKTLINGSQTAGYKSIQWNATNNLGELVSAGMYIYMIQAGEFIQTKKMILFK
jgi:Leucine-rich repeat (LRR) protein